MATKKTQKPMLLGGLILAVILISLVGLGLFSRKDQTISKTNCDLGARGTSPQLSTSAKKTVAAAYDDYSKASNCSGLGSGNAVLKRYVTDQYAKTFNAQRDSRQIVFCTDQKIASISTKRDKDDANLIYVDATIAGSSVGPRVMVRTEPDNKGNQKIASFECETGTAS